MWHPQQQIDGEDEEAGSHRDNYPDQQQHTTDTRTGDIGQPLAQVNPQQVLTGEIGHSLAQVHPQQAYTIADQTQPLRNSHVPSLNLEEYNQYLSWDLQQNNAHLLHSDRQYMHTDGQQLELHGLPLSEYYSSQGIYPRVHGSPTRTDQSGSSGSGQQPLPLDIQPDSLRSVDSPRTSADAEVVDPLHPYRTSNAWQTPRPGSSTDNVTGLYMDSSRRNRYGITDTSPINRSDDSERSPRDRANHAGHGDTRATQRQRQRSRPQQYGSSLDFTGLIGQLFSAMAKPQLFTPGGYPEEIFVGLSEEDRENYQCSIW